MIPRRFTRFAAFDWSGRAVPRPPGITLATCAAGHAAPILVAPDRGWSRPAALDWLIEQADAGTDMLIGIDFSPALPHADRGEYFPDWSESPADARALWALVDRLCAAEPHLSASTFVEHVETARHFRHASGGTILRGDRFEGSMGRLRVAERRCREMKRGNAVSCFNLIGASQVGKSSLTGMRLLHALAGRVPIWPFDPVPARGPLIVEIYTTIAARAAGVTGSRSKLRDGPTLDAALHALATRPHAVLPRYDDHATDALLGAAWLRHVAADPALWAPTGLDAALSATEGWTFGIP
ncbi:hypothetical protein [Sphingomonas montana]|uniref:hypothetical protein n=1 Tax=Sphingomonas montana TaxID=1843236 RepID=UPI00096CF6F5|nr:hypothetical protein [Sphingomonas montana]